MNRGCFVQAQFPGGHVLKSSAFFLLAGLLASSTHAQQLDSATKWATGTQTDFVVTPNVLYLKANNVEIHLDLVTPSKPSVPKPTVVYIHGGGWLESTKEAALLRMLPYLPRG